MSKLRVDFQDGFTGQEAIVRADGHERFRGTLKTRLQLGMAAVVDLGNTTGPVKLEVELPSTRQIARIELGLERDTFVCVSRDARGELVQTLAFEPPGYL